jgi:hypothetical protein
MLSAQMSTWIGAETAFATATRDARRCPNRVKTGKSRSEQMFSGLPPKADLTADIVDVSQVPKPDSCSAANEVHKLDAYSITSSARASTLAGMSRPSALAVLRLITSSYLVGACTGRSAGFSPLRMRST